MFLEAAAWRPCRRVIFYSLGQGRMKNRDLVSRWPHSFPLPDGYTEPAAGSLLGARGPRSSLRLGLFPPSLARPFPRGEPHLSTAASPCGSPCPHPCLPPLLAPAPPHTRTHALRAGTKAFKAALYIPPQLPAQPLLQRSPSKDAYSSAPKGPHCCQLVTGRHRDSRLTAPAKQEKWTRWGAKGPALFLSPLPASFSPQEIPFSARLFKPPPQSHRPRLHAGACT